MRKLEIYLRCLEQQRSMIDDFKRISYQKDGIEAYYPEFIAGGTKQQMSIWNDLIRKDFNQILQIYSVSPFPEIRNAPEGKAQPTLDLNYEIKNNNKVVSIFYKAKYYNPYSAYPTELVYTTNIDKEHNKRLVLSNMIRIDDSFIHNFKEWNIVPRKEENPNVTEAISEYQKNLKNQDLRKGFLSADQIGSSNLWQVYSYLTPDQLGISIYAPNYLGDHIEFERSLDRLQQYLKPGFIY